MPYYYVLVFRQALARHSHLTMYLLSPVSTTLPHYAAQRDAVIASAVHDFCTAFAPWGTESSTFDTRAKNLSQILREGTDLGLQLYGQPSKFEWRWDHSSLDAQQVIVVPAFIKIRDEDVTLDTELLSRRVSEV
jgi:hypothetical protein